MKVSFEYYDFVYGVWNTEVHNYSTKIWSSYWDAARRNEIEIIDCQMSYDNGETWKSVF